MFFGTVSALGTIICVANDLKYIMLWRVYRCFLIILVCGDVHFFFFLCLRNVASIFKVLGSWVEVSLAKFLQTCV